MSSHSSGRRQEVTPNYIVYLDDAYIWRQTEQDKGGGGRVSGAVLQKVVREGHFDKVTF